jgi:hypothetical protein
MTLGPVTAAPWRANDDVILAWLEELADHPALPPTMSAMAGNMLAVGETNPTLAAIFKDAGRYVAAMCAAALQTDLITFSRLQILCAGFGILSRGRVYALLQYLRYLGFVCLWANSQEDGARGYKTTPQFLESWRAHLRAALLAVSEIESFASEAAEQLKDDVFFAKICTVQMENLRAFSQKTDQSSDIFTIFLNRHAGSQILWSLIMQSSIEARSAQENPLTAAYLARKFDVSRMHVGRLLRDAERQGIVERKGSGFLVLTPIAITQLRTFYGWQVGLLLIAAARSHASCDVSALVHSGSTGV